MSKSTADKLSNEKIQQLLAAVGAKSQEDESQHLDTSDYDWGQPRYFNLKQVEKVGCFAETVAEKCIEEFSRLYQGDCSVSVASTEQLFSSEFDKEERQGGYYIPFGADSQRSFGLMRIPKSSALAWTGQVLGDTQSKEDLDRKLSKLEESFLLDIVSGLVGAFSRAYGSDLHPGKTIIQDWSLIELQGSEELLEITFEVGKIDSEESTAKASFLVCCDKLESIAGKTASQDKKLSEAQTAAAILEHVHQVPLSVRVELGTIMLAFKDVVHLQTDDILVLNKKVTDAVDVLVEGRTLFCGRPAQSGGKHAVVIV